MARAATLWAGLGLLMLAVLGFAVPSGVRGVQALVGESEAQGRLVGSLLSNLSIYGHMITGALISVLAVVQWAGPVRRHWPRVHRISGRVLVPLALITAMGGLSYIALRGTIGGPLMDVGFGLYGVLLGWAAVQTYRCALARDFVRHRGWGLRLVVLALGSWLYRVHYGLWFASTCSLSEALCGVGVQSDFRGLFDQIQVFAFYLPYLALVEWTLRHNTGAP